MDFGLNTDVYHDFILLMDVSTDGGRIAFQLVNNSTSDENPSGNAKISWDRMVAKYKPSTTPRYMRLEMDQINTKLAVGRNPDPWVVYIEQLVSEMNKCTVDRESAKTDTDIILHILCHLPEPYEGVVHKT